MARERKPPKDRPEERLVARVAEAVFDGTTATQHDDGTEDSMYDLRLSGSIEAAIEVGLITDETIRRSQAFWRKSLEPHQTPTLKWRWVFIFADHSGPSEQTSYPWVRRPSVPKLTEVLARLEERGIDRIMRAWDYHEIVPGGWRIGDEDVRGLFSLLGPLAENSSAVDLSHHGEVGGWEFGFAHGNVSSMEPNRFAERVEALLHEETREDMRSKLERSGLPVRIAALVFDSSTGDGWSTSHLGEGDCPTEDIQLPDGVTHVLILGMNDLVLMYGLDEGWSRYDVASSGYETSTL